jgi:uncharacterized protein
MMQTAPTSPCMNICVLDAGKVCIGCRRTLDEIARWGRMSVREQWQVVARLELERQQALAARSPAAAG